MLHDVVQRKKFYTLVLQKCLTRSDEYEPTKDTLIFLNKNREKLLNEPKPWEQKN